MVVKNGTNSFGHIGQSIALASLKNSDIQVVAINDRNRYLKFMVDKLRCNSTRDRPELQFAYDKTQFCIDGQTMTAFSERDQTTVSQANPGVDYLVEATGIFTTPDNPRAHLKVRTASTLLEDSSLIIVGVNEGCHKGESKLMLNASYKTTKPDGDTLGAMGNMMIALPATIVIMNAMDDSSKKDRRTGHGAAPDITQVSLCKTKSTPNDIPWLSDTLTENLMKISDSDVSVIHLTTSFEKAISYHEIISVIKEILEGDLHDMIGNSQHELLASGFADYSHSSLLGSKYSIPLVPHFIETNRCYDSAYSDYSTRLTNSIPQVA